ncbi:hypothetical protein KC19_3G134700 [Ceratodon purpureus]|uniref:Uncharacterized protein n=1 Tax=Ceratodon purpureus TaxID=3225 RepID=A0A8T0ILH2_CERPU|nr:hypothetical protein KC19_3G134700 [Ceratodon purpureus]
MGVVVHSTRAGSDPQTTSQNIVALARERAEDCNRQSPFSTAAQEAGFRFYGGSCKFHSDSSADVTFSWITLDAGHVLTILKYIYMGCGPYCLTYLKLVAYFLYYCHYSLPTLLTSKFGRKKSINRW